MTERSKTPPKHRNDIYGEDPASPEGDSPAIPAATVVLLREVAGQAPVGQAPVGEAPAARMPNSETAIEVLMLHKASRIAFGGMWVFPGGRIDADDFTPGCDLDTAARTAAARETREETGLLMAADGFVWFAHWTPPPGTPKRFATWFFAARAEQHEVTIDGGEIQNHAWLTPAEALSRHAAGRIDLAPPTWVTLHELAQHRSVDAALGHLRARPPQYYETRIGKRADGVRVAMWRGDAGYVRWDADAPGPRHRLVMAPGSFVFEHSIEVLGA